MRPLTRDHPVRRYLSYWNRPRPERLYWETLGRFVDQFSVVENLIRGYLWYLMDIGQTTGAAVLSGVRMSEGISLINRLLEAKNDDLSKSALAKYFNQLGVINSLRNDLLHYGGWVDELHYISVSNRQVAHTQDRIRAFRISMRELRYAIGDLETIYWALAVHLANGIEPREWHSLNHDSLDEPLRYKQPPQVAPRNSSRKNPPKRQRRSGATPR